MFRHPPGFLGAKRLQVLGNVITLKKAARAEDKLHKLDTVVVGGKRRVRRENGVGHGFDHRLLEVEKLVDHKARCQLPPQRLAHCPN